MTLPSLVWGAPRWLAVALALLGIAGLLLLWSYARARAARPVRIACATLKALAFTALVLSLLEPLLTGSRPKPGANAFAILADNSQSLLVRDDPAGQSRGDWMRALLQKEAPWRTRLGQDFDVRGYAFDSHLRAVEAFEGLAFDGTGSAIPTSLAGLARRFHGLPLAGVLLVSDGNRTDTSDLDWSQLPPVYPVMPPSRRGVKDIGISNVTVSQTNFESAPVVVRADVTVNGFPGDTIVAAVTDESGNDVERIEEQAPTDSKPINVRFQFRPDKRGLHFYNVRAFVASDPARGKESDASGSTEQTLANNSRLVVVDQGGGPYRVLYVSGRPNWEFKFLRRAIDDDEQVELVGLLRIARRQPKFDFRNPRDTDASPFYKGFDNADPDTAERHDEPVLVRLGTKDEVELRDGFPKAIEELYRYHAVILDDLEAGFFTQDQLALLRSFVSRRGGGLLMLGGPDSFVDGKYDRTPVGELLPVYLDRHDDAPGDGAYRLVLTREGWLQPWVRTRKTEDDERRRLAGMTPFHTLSHVGNVKPGAVVLSEVRDAGGRTSPALVAQQFGKGHVAALLIGDLWRWGLRRESLAEDDLDRSWRQTVRWLVGDVPGRVDIAVRPKTDAAAPAVEIQVRPRDAEYRPLDNGKVTLQITRPGGDTLSLDAPPDGREAGSYTAAYVAKDPGPYRVLASVTAPDGSVVGQREAGWAAQPAADEFARLEPDREYLQMIASKTHGELVDSANLDSFVKSLSSRAAPITEPWISPLWHQPLSFLIAIACLVAEWGLRRVNGLA